MAAWNPLVSSVQRVPSVSQLWAVRSDHANVALAAELARPNESGRACTPFGSAARSSHPGAFRSISRTGCALSVKSACGASRYSLALRPASAAASETDGLLVFLPQHDFVGH